MSAQRYSSPVAHERMAAGTCPECGQPADTHSSNPRFWERFGPCDLLPNGVSERIEQYRADQPAVSPVTSTEPTAPTDSGLRSSGVTAVVVVEKVVFGVPAYHAHCLSCGWRCHREPHDREATAIDHAKHHACSPAEAAARDVT